MPDNVWEWFDDFSQNRYDAVLFHTCYEVSDCLEISLESLYAAYTLHNMELHCVTNKTTGWVHTDNDRKNCGLVFSLGGIYRFMSGDRSMLLENNRILYLPTHGQYTHTFLSSSDRRNPWQADIIVLNFHLRDPEGSSGFCLTNPCFCLWRVNGTGKNFSHWQNGFLPLTDNPQS